MVMILLYGRYICYRDNILLVYIWVNYKDGLCVEVWNI